MWVSSPGCIFTSSILTVFRYESHPFRLSPPWAQTHSPERIRHVTHSRYIPPINQRAFPRIFEHSNAASSSHSNLFVLQLPILPIFLPALNLPPTDSGYSPTMARPFLAPHFSSTFLRSIKMTQTVRQGSRGERSCKGSSERRDAGEEGGGVMLAGV
jgi:hypothetical protein